MILEFTEVMEELFGSLGKFVGEILGFVVALLLVGFFGYFVVIVAISPIWIWIESINLGILLTGALFLYIGFVRFFSDEWVLKVFFISWLLTLCATLFNFSLLAEIFVRIAIMAFYWVVLWIFKNWFRN